MAANRHWRDINPDFSGAVSQQVLKFKLPVRAGKTTLMPESDYGFEKCSLRTAHQLAGKCI